VAYPNGFNYVSGPLRYVLSTVSSTATFVARVPVTLNDDRSVGEAASDTTALFGVAHHNAADSIYAGKCLIEVPTEQTVYAVKVQTGVATSALSIGQSYGLEKSGNYLRVDTDSQATPFVTLVPRDDGSTCDSADSTVFVTILGDKLGVFGSNASVNVFAQT
jgi:hypothetical protein